MYALFILTFIVIPMTIALIALVKWDYNREFGVIGETITDSDYPDLLSQEELTDHVGDCLLLSMQSGVMSPRGQALYDEAADEFDGLDANTDDDWYKLLGLVEHKYTAQLSH